MKASEILRKAARCIETGISDWGCEAILVASGVSLDDLPVDNNWRVDYGAHIPESVMRYFRLMQGSRAQKSSGWFGSAYYADNQDRRVLALCFAAAIAESEGN